MKYASITFVLLGLFGSLFSACAEGDQPEFGTNSPTGGEGGAGGAGGGAGGSAAKVCVDKCTADSECALTCEAAPKGSSNCCDKMTGQCFVSDVEVCPVPQPGTGGGGTGMGGGMMY